MDEIRKWKTFRVFEKLIYGIEIREGNMIQKTNKIRTKTLMLQSYGWIGEGVVHTLTVHLRSRKSISSHCKIVCVCVWVKECCTLVTYIAQSVLEQCWRWDNLLVSGERKNPNTLSYMNYETNYSAFKSIHIRLEISMMSRPDNPEEQTQNGQARSSKSHWCWRRGVCGWGEMYRVFTWMYVTWQTMNHFAWDVRNTLEHRLNRSLWKPRPLPLISHCPFSGSQCLKAAGLSICLSRERRLK